MVKQYQVCSTPASCVPTASLTARIAAAIERANQENGARCSSSAKPSTWCARPGYLQSLDDFRKIL